MNRTLGGAIVRTASMASGSWRPTTRNGTSGTRAAALTNVSMPFRARFSFVTLPTVTTRGSLAAGRNRSRSPRGEGEEEVAPPKDVARAKAASRASHGSVSDLRHRDDVPTPRDDDGGPAEPPPEEYRARGVAEGEPGEARVSPAERTEEPLERRARRTLHRRDVEPFAEDLEVRRHERSRMLVEEQDAALLHRNDASSRPGRCRRQVQKPFGLARARSSSSHTRGRYHIVRTKKAPALRPKEPAVLPVAVMSTSWLGNCIR